MPHGEKALTHGMCRRRQLLDVDVRQHNAGACLHVRGEYNCGGTKGEINGK